MTPKQARHTLNQMFKNHRGHLRRAIRDFEDGEQARLVAHRHVEPILVDLEAAQGQQLDATYVAYLIEYAFRSID